MTTIKGKLYTIFCTEDDTFYIGSTTRQYLSQRMGGHRADAQKGSNSRLYNHMRAVGIDKFYIQLISVKEYPSREALVAREYELIRKYMAIDPENCLNMECDLGKRAPSTVANMRAVFATEAYRNAICKYNYTITFKDGSIVKTQSLRRYCEENGYNHGDVFGVLHGRYKSYKNIVKVEQTLKQQ